MCNISGCKVTAFSASVQYLICGNFIKGNGTGRFDGDAPIKLTRTK